MSRNGYDDDDDHFVKYKGPQKKAEIPRKELLGVGPSRVPKAKARQMEIAAAASSQKSRDEALEYDPNSDNPLRRAEQKELEQLAVRKAKEVTHDLQSVLKISEDTQVVGSKTLETLKAQGEQITRTHEKAVQLEQEMAQGAKLLNKLGGMFSAPWKVKKGKKIAGPSYLSETADSIAPANAANRGGLLSKQTKAAKPENREGTYLDRVEDETERQDDILDQISSNLRNMKGMAIEMGRETERQNVAIDELKEDASELHNRQVQANKRGQRILRR